jgi:2-methylcitrate dehydratase PrpD
VAAIDAQIGIAQNAMLRNTGARSGLEAKFSLEFALACALIAGDVGLRELDDAFVKRPDIQDLMGRVRRSLVHTVCPIEPVFALHDRIRIHLHSGQVLDSGDIRFARGNFQTPLTVAEIRNKFMSCAESGGFGEEAARIYEALMRLEALDTLPALPRQATTVPHA